jgi:hypothetical protein
VTIDGLHLPLGILEHHLLILVLLDVHLLFALPLAGRHAFLARLLLLLMSFLISQHSLTLWHVELCIRHHHHCYQTLDGGACCIVGFHPHLPPQLWLWGHLPAASYCRRPCCCCCRRPERWLLHWAYYPCLPSGQVWSVMRSALQP